MQTTPQGGIQQEKTSRSAPLEREAEQEKAMSDQPPPTNGEGQTELSEAERRKEAVAAMERFLGVMGTADSGRSRSLSSGQPTPPLGGEAVAPEPLASP